MALRPQALARVLGLAKPQAPHATTFSRVLKGAVQIEELEQVVREFFANQLKAGSRVLNLDDETLRGTIPAGKTQGVHREGAYLPGEEWVWFQVEVGSWENEIPIELFRSMQLWYNRPEGYVRVSRAERDPAGLLESSSSDPCRLVCL